MISFKQMHQLIEGKEHRVTNFFRNRNPSQVFFIFGIQWEVSFPRTQRNIIWIGIFIELIALEIPIQGALTLIEMTKHKKTQLNP